MDKEKEISDSLAACAACGVGKEERACCHPGGKGAKGCPTLIEEGLCAKTNQAYGGDQTTLAFARAASRQEAACYVNRHERPYVMQPTKTRMVEISEFAGRMGYKRLGLAFCLGLTREAQVVAEILGGHGFEVVSVLCKAGATPKEFLGLAEEDKIFQGGHESMCNPIFQAEILNRSRAEMNILLGLCVGHDALFFQHAQAPTTVLAVKDRVTGHNPLAAVYNAESYYAKIWTKGG